MSETAVSTTPLPAAGQLAARTVPLDPARVPGLSDIGSQPGNAFWHHDDLDLVGVGEALRIPLAGGAADLESAWAAEQTLAAIATDDAVNLRGTGPLAVGALPYDPAQPAWVRVPRLVIGRCGEAAWATLVARPEELAVVDPRSEVARLQVHERRPEPDGFSLSSPLSHDQWKALISVALGDIAGGQLDKVVVARRVDVVANRPFNIAVILDRLHALYPTCMVCHLEGFVAASPEILVSRQGRRVVSHPLAGTVARSGDVTADAQLVASLLASPKERWEHSLVVDAIVERLGLWCEELTVPQIPEVMALRNVSHLGTLIEGQLRTEAPGALTLAASLQPTPAVGGTPTGAALTWQRRHEGFARGRYAGPVGWVDRQGDGAFAIGLRCADIEDDRASLYAGVGVVAGSDPPAELAETQLKLQAVLAAVVRP